MRERSSIGGREDGSRRGRPLFMDAAVGLPIPGTKYSALTHSDPLIKSTSDEDFVSTSRHSSASAATSPGGYLSDRTTSSAASSNTQHSAASSPFSSSPWHHHEQSANTATATADLFPSGTGLVGSLVREEGHIYSLAAGARGLLYTGSDSKNIRVWRDRREFSGFKSSSGLVKAIVLSANGHRVFSGHQDGKIRVWAPSPKDPATHKRVSTLPRLKDLLKASFHPSAARRRRRGGAVRIRHTDAVSCLCLSEDESLLYSGSWDRTIKAWRIADSQCVDSIDAHDDAVNAVVAAFKGLVFSGSADGTVKVWRRETTTAKKESVTGHAAEKTLMKQDSAVTALSINVDAGVVYAGSSDGVVNCWDWGRRLEHCGTLRGHAAAVLCLAAAGAGSTLLFSGSADKTICVWRREEETGAHSCLSVLTAHTGPVKCLAVQADAADGKEGEEDCGGARRRWVVYSGSLDKSVKVWKVAEPAAGQVAEPMFDTY
uniref:Protein JINGUBANG n=1 Tax=Ananas comosus var. bracteatus TaxID=296719 RepID=A0A6V7P0H9_ANACO|nr:unnamed protein product [Ananas comosus var. bracteatus]